MTTPPAVPPTPVDADAEAARRRSIFMLHAFGPGGSFAGSFTPAEPQFLNIGAEAAVPAKIKMSKRYLPSYEEWRTIIFVVTHWEHGVAGMDVKSFRKKYGNCGYTWVKKYTVERLDDDSFVLWRMDPHKDDRTKMVRSGRVAYRAAAYDAISAAHYKNDHDRKATRKSIGRDYVNISSELMHLFHRICPLCSVMGGRGIKKEGELTETFGPGCATISVEGTGDDAPGHRDAFLKIAFNEPPRTGKEKKRLGNKRGVVPDADTWAHVVHVLHHWETGYGTMNKKKFRKKHREGRQYVKLFRVADVVEQPVAVAKDDAEKIVAVQPPEGV
eukprot:CAMPEP_0194341532 /NCGR_PEP_ID=MMETSP0171-20130528/90027_1 /TAXON_ID=218684 /ORGANISM="Corethron pennatum, Strain L29A3" /LENGTH=328 /DNA_ID=CAMNT_0039106917 /DNA_START=19 /DNA_END=1002 /DNA_ORIENTATION=-